MLAIDKDAAIGRDRTERLPRMAAAGFAALAESGLFFLPIMEFSSESVRGSNGPLQAYGIFVPLFVFGVVAGTLVRRFRLYTWVTAAAGVALGLAQGLAWGDGNGPGTGFIVVLSLLVALRVVSLGARDWRDPVKGQFVWGATGALVELAVSGSANPEWRSLLPVVVVQFFAGSLASRASIVAVDRPGRTAIDARRWGSFSLVPLGALAAVLVLSIVLGGRHGLLRIVGTFAARLVGWVLIGVAYVTARVILQPLNWLLSRMHVSLRPLQHLLLDLTRDVRVPHRGAHHLINAPWLERVAGLAALLAMAALVVWLINRHRRQTVAGRRRLGTSDASSPIEPEPSPRFRLRRPRLHRELPAGAVRRWYAEALLALERRGLAKLPPVTPREYLGDVARAFPACGTEFEALTRTYEDVRYGSRSVDRSTLRRIEEARGPMMEVLRRSDRADRPKDEGDDTRGEEEAG